MPSIRSINRPAPPLVHTVPDRYYGTPRRHADLKQRRINKANKYRPPPPTIGELVTHLWAQLCRLVTWLRPGKKLV